MESQTKQCQNCHNEFTIEPDDFAFYEKMKVPPPTFCPDCRLVRRMTFRNERTLYKRKNQAPGKEGEMILSVFPPESEQVVYDHTSWWGDTWDAASYGQKIDYAKPFFEQLKDLWRKVPDMSLYNLNSVRSDYCNIVEGNKDCYMIVGGDFNEDSLYSAFIFNSHKLADCYWVSKSEGCYECSDSISCSRLFYSRYCEGCLDGAFLFNCKNCLNCFGCVNLRNKSYCIFNRQYTKKEYEEKLKEYRLDSHEGIERIKNDFEKFSLNFPRKFAHMISCVDSSGNNLENCRNCKQSFDVFGGAQDSKYVWLVYSNVADFYDCDHSGLSSARCFEVSVAYPASDIMFSRFILNSHHIQYSYNCYGSSYLFGCVGMRDKEYCIFNKQYTKEEYEKTIPLLVSHMNDKPYVDRNGIVYRYGEFFPVEISPFTHNESVAQELQPLTQDGAKEKNLDWREPADNKYSPTIEAKDLPDTIDEVSDDITKEVISCAHNKLCAHACPGAFKITPQELAFYKSFKIPIPHLCSNCRHYERIAPRPPVKLWHRKCQCAGIMSENGAYQNTAKHSHGENPCKNEFETPYASDRQEIVYCEQCYQQEVA
jgi:hypothetical protein